MHPLNTLTQLKCFFLWTNSITLQREQKASRIMFHRAAFTLNPQPCYISASYLQSSALLPPLTTFKRTSSYLPTLHYLSTVFVMALLSPGKPLHSTFNPTPPLRHIFQLKFFFMLKQTYFREVSSRLYSHFGGSRCWTVLSVSIILSSSFISVGALNSRNGKWTALMWSFSSLIDQVLHHTCPHTHLYKCTFIHQ